MEIKEFIQHFAEQLDETDVNELNAETKFRDLEEWSSIIGLSIILMVDEEYGITIGADDMKQAQTIGDLFNIVQAKA